MPFRGNGNTENQVGWGDQHLTGFGRFLRQAREYKGVSLREVERKTRIPRRHLHALETEEFGLLPPLIYARGIVRNYAQYLGVDPRDALSRFEQSHGQRSGGFQVVPAVKTTEVPSHWAPNFAIIAFMVIMSAVIFAWMYSAYFAPPENGSTTEQAVETPEADQEVAIMNEDDDGEPLSEGGGESLLPLQIQRENRESEGMEDGELETIEDGEIEASGATDETIDQTEETTEEPADVDPMTSQPSDSPGTHVFSISVTQSVWVQAAVDGEVVIDDVLEPGSAYTLHGELLYIESGNAPYVTVSVDGEDRGVVGEYWDSASSYP